MKILKTFTLVFIIVLILTGFQTLKSSEPVRKELLENHNGREVYLFKLTNKSGNVLKVINYGAKIVRIEVPDKNGLKDNVTLGSETLESILKGEMFGGAIVGRYASRIANAKFTLDGYDHNFVLDNKKRVDTKVFDPVSGRILEVIADQSGMQFFSGNGLSWKKSAGSGSMLVNTRSGFALETQHYPDSPNHPDFPSTFLNPREKFKSITIYRFSLKKQS